jgi:hypothetical protein
MRWRLLKLNWAYATGELVIVVSGVLIALAVDQLNTSRLNRLDESVILQQLIADLSEDGNDLAFEASMVTAKEASLLRLRAALSQSDNEPIDSMQVLEDMMTGSNFGWNQSSARRTTYEELLSSGRFSLIQEPSVRAQITNYYNEFEDRVRRQDERETPFPHLSYQFVPREYLDTTGNENRVRLDPEFTRGGIEQLISRIRASETADYIVAEINLARFILAMNANQDRLRTELIDSLEKYAEDF